MKIKSPIISQASGSVAGLTGSHNQGGLYFRARSVPTNPASAAQVAVRDAATVLVTAWGSVLTESQREAWRTYAANVPLTDTLGEQRTVSAIAHFVRSNVSRDQAGLPAVFDAPTTFDLGSFTTVDVSATAADPYTVDVTFDDTDEWVGEDDSAMLVYLSRQQSPGIQFFAGPYRLAASNIAGSTSSPPTSPATIAAQFAGTASNAIFGYVRVSRSDGRLSGVQRFRSVLS